MKDLEKIKSEEVAAQVQDANPANFAIEQEVAQLVGATVPQPTEPSADDARELGAQLLVFLRRALTPIQSALRTAVAAIYAHLDSRCTAYTPAAYAPYIPRPYDPMGPFVPRTLPNLLTAITAFAPRKISNGSAPNDGIPDGTSLAHLLCSGSVTELKDDNKGWTMTRQLSTWFNTTSFPSVTKLTLGMAHRSNYGILLENNNVSDLAIPYLEDILGYQPIMRGYTGSMKVLSIPSLKKYDTRGTDNANSLIYGCPNVEELLVENLEFVHHYSRNGGDAGWAMIGNMANLWHVKFGTMHTWEGSWTGSANFIIDCPALIDLEFGQGTDCSIHLGYWNPTDKGTTFLQNFKNHIALRLTANGSGLTLTLSQAVRDAIHAAEATYGIEAIIVTQKGWTLSPAPTA